MKHRGLRLELLLYCTFISGSALGASDMTGFGDLKAARSLKQEEIVDCHRLLEDYSENQDQAHCGHRRNTPLVFGASLQGLVDYSSQNLFAIEHLTDTRRQLVVEYRKALEDGAKGRLLNLEKGFQRLVHVDDRSLRECNRHFDTTANKLKAGDNQALLDLDERRHKTCSPHSLELQNPTDDETLLLLQAAQAVDAIAAMREKARETSSDKDELDLAINTVLAGVPVLAPMKQELLARLDQVQAGSTITVGSLADLISKGAGKALRGPGGVDDQLRALDDYEKYAERGEDVQNLLDPSVQLRPVVDGDGVRKHLKMTKLLLDMRSAFRADGHDPEKYAAQDLGACLLERQYKLALKTQDVVDNAKLIADSGFSFLVAFTGVPGAMYLLGRSSLSAASAVDGYRSCSKLEEQFFGRELAKRTAFETALKKPFSEMGNPPGVAEAQAMAASQCMNAALIDLAFAGADLALAGVASSQLALASAAGRSTLAGGILTSKIMGRATRAARIGDWGLGGAGITLAATAAANCDESVPENNCAQAKIGLALAASGFSASRYLDYRQTRANRGLAPVRAQEQPPRRAAMEPEPLLAMRGDKNQSLADLEVALSRPVAEAEVPEFVTRSEARLDELLGLGAFEGKTKVSLPELEAEVQAVMDADFAEKGYLTGTAGPNGITTAAELADSYLHPPANRDDAKREVLQAMLKNYEQKAHDSAASLKKNQFASSEKRLKRLEMWRKNAVRAKVLKAYAQQLDELGSDPAIKMQGAGDIPASQRSRYLGDLARARKRLAKELDAIDRDGLLSGEQKLAKRTALLQSTAHELQASIDQNLGLKTRVVCDSIQSCALEIDDPSNNKHWASRVQKAVDAPMRLELQSLQEEVAYFDPRSGRIANSWTELQVGTRLGVTTAHELRHRADFENVRWRESSAAARRIAKTVPPEQQQARYEAEMRARGAPLRQPKESTPFVAFLMDPVQANARYSHLEIPPDYFAFHITGEIDANLNNARNILGWAKVDSMTAPNWFRRWRVRVNGAKNANSSLQRAKEFSWIDKHLAQEGLKKHGISKVERLDDPRFQGIWDFQVTLSDGTRMLVRSSDITEGELLPPAQQLTHEQVQGLLRKLVRRIDDLGDRIKRQGQRAAAFKAGNG